MELKIKYVNSNVPLWCQTLDEDSLVTVSSKDGKVFSLDSESSHPTEKGFFRKSNHIFRFKYVTSKGVIFYCLAIARKVPYANEDTFSVDMVPGVEILKSVVVQDGVLSRYQWVDEFIPLGNTSNPFYLLVEAAKKYELKNPPMYLNFIDKD